MAPWKYSPEKIQGVNKEKMKQMQRHFPGRSVNILWHYLVFIHRCNFKGRLDESDSEIILEMLGGPMYDAAAFKAMESPLLETMISLRTELKQKDLKCFHDLDKVQRSIADQMERARDSSHRVTTVDEGRANEYIVFFREQKKLKERGGT
jgi:hypothetical protein